MSGFRKLHQRQQGLEIAEASGEFSRFSADLRERLEFFGLLSIHNPAIRKILDVCYEAAAGKG